MLSSFADRILACDLPAARVLATTYRVPEHAALIAAVAQANDLVTATRNTKPFEPLWARLLDPWE